MNQQIAIAVFWSFLLIDERIVDDVRENLVKSLPGHVDRASVFLIVAPLGPA